MIASRFKRHFLKQLAVVGLSATRHSVDMVRVRIRCRVAVWRALIYIIDDGAACGRVAESRSGSWRHEQDGLLRAIKLLLCP
jgi:hypothetical protein